MYTPKHFSQTDHDQLQQFIAAYPLAVLICNSATGMDGNHIPLYLDERNGGYVLKGHIASANTLNSEVENHSSVLVIFQGPQGYISPDWYATKKEHGKVVPTWNYTAIYINGTISFITDNDWKLDMLNYLTNRQEQRAGTTWQVADAPAEFIDTMLSGIVGIEIVVDTLRSQWKLSQNQPEKNQDSVRAGLSQSSEPGSEALLAFMTNLRQGATTSA